jgi:hypothetical protein
MSAWGNPDQRDWNYNDRKEIPLFYFFLKTEFRFQVLSFNSSTYLSTVPLKKYNEGKQREV